MCMGAPELPGALETVMSLGSGYGVLGRKESSGDRKERGGGTCGDGGSEIRFCLSLAPRLWRKWPPSPTSACRWLSSAAKADGGLRVTVLFLALLALQSVPELPRPEPPRETRPEGRSHRRTAGTWAGDAPRPRRALRSRSSEDGAWWCEGTPARVTAEARRR